MTHVLAAEGGYQQFTLHGSEWLILIGSALTAIQRRADGTYVRWTARRTSVGRGEGASGLAFDSAIRRVTPPPPG